MCYFELSNRVLHILPSWPEAKIGAWDIMPAELCPAPWEPYVDYLSLIAQKGARRIGISLPDIRFRLITNPESDDIKGSHFGTLAGAKQKAEKMWDIRTNTIDGKYRVVEPLMISNKIK